MKTGNKEETDGKGGGGEEGSRDEWKREEEKKREEKSRREKQEKRKENEKTEDDAQTEHEQQSQKANQASVQTEKTEGNMSINSLFLSPTRRGEWGGWVSCMSIGSDISWQNRQSILQTLFLLCHSQQERQLVCLFIWYLLLAVGLFVVGLSSIRCFFITCMMGLLLMVNTRKKFYHESHPLSSRSLPFSRSHTFIFFFAIEGIYRQTSHQTTRRASQHDENEKRKNWSSDGMRA